ncbi:cupin domain-containing protein [Pseudothermotoga sp.]
MQIERSSGKLSELVQYQDGSIVSRTILDKKAGTVTIFAFDKSQRLSEHTAPFDALVYVLDGECEIKISGQSHHLKAGDFIVMPANEPHAVNALERFKMLLVMIKS